MLVSHTHKFIFIKTRKTAGSSIEKFLEPYAQVGPTISEWEDHHTPAQIVKDYVGDQKWKEYTKIISMRNPWDQVVSLYYWRGRKRKRRHLFSKFIRGKQVINPARKMEFGEWVRFKNDSLNENRVITYIDGKLPQYDYIHFEDLTNSLEAVCKKIGIPFSQESLLHLKGGHRPNGAYQSYYDQETREIVRHAFSLEIEDFGYTF